MTFRPNRSIAALAGLLTLAAGTAWSEASGQPAADPDAPLSGMVAVVLRDPGPTTADNLSDYLKQLVALYNADRARLRGIRFPLENATTDTVRVLDGLRHNVVVKWLDPLTFADGPEAPRFGANADFLAYFGDGWNADWAAGGLGSPPQFSGSGTSGWVWSNHEYVSNEAPTPTSAPTGQHLTLARFLRAAGVLANDVESDLWTQHDVDAYIRQEKRQVGGSWFHVVQDEGTGAWRLDRGAPNRRYDATSATRLLVTGTTLSGLDHDDAGLYLPTGVVAGIMGDCSGCVTPWGTVITAEENVQDYYGDLEAAFPSSNNAFVAGAGFDPGADIDPVMTASTSADFGRISDPQRPSHARRVRVPERDRSRPAERVEPDRRSRPPEAGRRGACPLGERQHRHRRFVQADPGAAGRDVRGQRPPRRPRLQVGLRPGVPGGHEQGGGARAAGRRAYLRVAPGRPGQRHRLPARERPRPWMAPTAGAGAGSG